MESAPQERIDLSRLPRKERRRIGKKLQGKILGRNLPFQKDLHGDIHTFYKLRAEEIANEQKK